jgi:hypothetical protein
MKTARLASILLGVLAVGFGQTYKCDWSVNGIGGGVMTSGAYRCGATAGQTAAGLIAGPQYWAMIGFWQPETAGSGIREQAQWPNQGRLVTRLCTPQPCPFRGAAAIRYSLAVQIQTTLQVSDLTGRVVRTLVNSVQTPGRYSARWDGRDGRGRMLAHGVYFCHLRAGEYTATRKMVKTD